ncbi:hypothetical protein [Desulfitobacterium metallireducens]|uniref:Uncharacterized protein n=1 Tax=Desulfitobacterium metallireducens DSM 15288 TaxID=871968 RepID=W0E7D8_9FIRM|nr:hypothetical protein [Desulfitobacterium metallireducens]AHF06667.1 hypothetical protein DESME_06055 [Desulfitobacterium metallireducens DSM 15288]
MLSSNEEVLKFIREFEDSSRDYLLSHGTSEHDLGNAYLELQWQFLQTILKTKTASQRRRSVQVLRKNTRATIA